MAESQNKRHLMTTSDKGMIIPNCFYCEETPVCQQVDLNFWVVYCGNPDCKFKKKFTAHTHDEALLKWDAYIRELEHPGRAERVQGWKDLQELVMQHRVGGISDEEYKREMKRLLGVVFKK